MKPHGPALTIHPKRTKGKDCAYCRHSETQAGKEGTWHVICQLALPGPAEHCSTWSDSRKDLPPFASWHENFLYYTKK